MIHAFTFKDMNLVLDVESGALHSMDKPAFDVVRTLETGGDPYALPYSREDIRSILDELDKLKSEGAFDSEPLVPPKGNEESVIKSLCLHIAHDCNLRCRYCFASTGDFHGARMFMTEDVAKRSLEFLMERSGRRHNLEVDLFGGEPLMNFDVVKSTVAYGRELEKKYNKHINFTITTNCLALNDEMIDFINDNMHNVVLSLDGRKEVHDALRPTVNGKGSYDIIVPKATELVKRRGDKEYYVRGTFTNRNLDFTKDVDALRSLGFEQISIEPVVLAEDSPYAILENHVKAILDEYDRLADMLLESRRNGRWFNFFHFMIDLSGGPCLKKRVSGCGAGVEYAAITPDGDIYPCHQFVGEAKYKMGNVMTGEFDGSIREEFIDCNILTKPQCSACFAKYYCAGGCAANAYKYNGDIRKPYAITCEFEKKRAELALGIYAKEHQ